jgi:sialic acid synthase SpsE
MELKKLINEFRKFPSKHFKPYIIAEAGVNHEGDFEIARRLIREAKEGGAHAIKFQTYKAEKIASKNSPSYWDLSKEPTESQFTLFKKYDSFNEFEYIKLAKYCKEVDIEFASTPFDSEAVDFLDNLMSFYKIASADLTNTPLLRQVAGKSKPVILSTGCATIGEIDHALSTLQEYGCEDIIFLHCVLNYPTPDNNANLAGIKHLKHSYPNNLIGYSDHTVPDSEMKSLVTAYLLGAMVIEKHFTHDKTLPGNDHYHAMDKFDCENFVRRVEHTQLLLGDLTFKAPLPSEKLSIKNARRSIVLTKDLKAGDCISLENITCKRPGTGISPLHWDDILGKKVSKDLNEDHILMWPDIEDL